MNPNKGYKNNQNEYWIESNKLAVNFDKLYFY